MEDWVRQKKAEALRKKMVTPTMPSYAMMYTGDGPASESAGMVSQGGQPFQVHKGEMLQPMPEGTFVMNQRTTKQAYPSFAAGGFNPYNPGTKEAYEWNKANSTAKDITKSLVDLTTESDSTKVGSNPYNAGTKEYAEWMRVNAVPSSLPTGGQGTVEESLLTKPPSGGPGSNEKGVQNTPVAPVQTPPQTTTETDARTTGLNYMTDSLNQPNIANKQVLDAMSSRAMQERSAADQRAAQTGVTGTQARVEGQMLRNQQESELNATAADLAASDQAARLTTAGNLASTGLAGQQFEQAKAQYGNTKAWTDFEYTAQYGSDADVIAAYKTATGKDLDPAAVAEIRGYARTKRAQDVTQGQITLDAGQLANEATKLRIESFRLDTFIKAVNNGADLVAANTASGLTLTQPQMDSIATRYRQTVDTGELALQATRNALGDDIYNSVQNMIDKGSSLAAINAKLAELGKPAMELPEYTSMLNATPLGERNWGRNLSAANMLLTNGQFDKAAEAYNEVFPGVDFDFTTLKNAQQNESFTAGLSELAGYIAADIDRDTAIGMLTASKTLENMGISAVDAAQLYDSMYVNAFDEEWKKFEESDLYKGLSEIEKAEQKEFYEAKLLGKLDFTTLHEYNITAPDGAVTTIYGEDSTEADKAAAKIGGTVKDTGNIKYQLASTINTVSADGTTTYTLDQWEKTPINTKWEYFEKNNAQYTDIKTKEEWIDAGMPHPSEGVIEKALDATIGKMPPTIRESNDMFLETATPEVKKAMTDLFAKITTGTGVDAFNTDKDGGTIAAWVELNEGRKIYVGDKAYTVTSYKADNRAGDRAIITLTDSDGVPLEIQGTKSERKDAGQAATEAATSAAFVQGLTGFLYDGVKELQNGDVGAAALSFLTGGLSGIIKRWKKRRK